MRYKVALGVAEALNYLHGLAEPIIHRDVKSSNILLSDDFEPQVLHDLTITRYLDLICGRLLILLLLHFQLSDFGLATWASSCLHHMRTSDVAGTFGLDFIAFSRYIVIGNNWIRIIDLCFLAATWLQNTL